EAQGFRPVGGTVHVPARRLANGLEGVQDVLVVVDRQNAGLVRAGVFAGTLGVLAVVSVHRTPPSERFLFPVRPAAVGPPPAHKSRALSRPAAPPRPQRLPAASR